MIQNSLSWIKNNFKLLSTDCTKFGAGYKVLALKIDGQKSLAWRIVWTVIVLAGMAVAFLFIYNAAENFLKSTVVTTIHSTTGDLFLLCHDK